jgi:hypothetical protein
MNLGSFVISSTSIKIIVLFQCTSNGKYNAFYHGPHPTRYDTCTAQLSGTRFPSGVVSAPKGPKAQLIPYRIIWIIESLFSSNRYWADSTYLVRYDASS